MRITEAAERLDMTPRMLRYRESLGLLPALRQSRRGSRRAASAAGPGTRRGNGRLPDGHQRAGQGPGERRQDADRAAGRAAGHRQFTDADVAAVALGLSIERRYDISPVTLAFGIRVLADHRIRAEVAELGRRIGRIQAPPTRALDFEQERALRLLSLGGRPAPRRRQDEPARRP
jgi:MerR family transcriptional regulator, copper efflux regulator